MLMGLFPVVVRISINCRYIVHGKRRTEKCLDVYPGISTIAVHMKKGLLEKFGLAGSVSKLICREEYMHREIKEQIAEINRGCVVGKGEKLEEWVRLSEPYIRAYGFTYIYYLMSTWYESLTGKKAPCNFGVYRGWKVCVRQSCIRQGFTGDETEKVISAIGTGTQYKREKRDPETVVRLLL